MDGIGVSDMASVPCVNTVFSVMRLGVAWGSDPGGISWDLDPESLLVRIPWVVTCLRIL